MARPRRLQIADAWYHVIAPGIESCSCFSRSAWADGSFSNNCFRGDRDREHFLALLPLVRERFGIHLHAYVLMTNHYHLIIQTPETNLSQAVQWLNVSYSLWFNRRHRRVGLLFHGRFKAVLVEAQSWALPLSRYVHLNPVRIKRLGLDKTAQQANRRGMAQAPSVELVRQRLATLNSYKWSSYLSYIGHNKAPDWRPFYVWAEEPPATRRQFIGRPVKHCWARPGWRNHGPKSSAASCLGAGILFGASTTRPRRLRPCASNCVAPHMV